MSQGLADRFTALGARVSLIPHGADPAPPELVARRAQRRAGAAVTAGLVGTLDQRLDGGLIRALAERHPDWTIRLVGPVRPGFDPAAFADLANVRVEGPVAPDLLYETLASFDLGLMPYIRDELAQYMQPVKNLEFMACGIPAVGTDVPGLRPFRDLVPLVDDADGFVAAAERALAEETPERRRARLAVAAEGTWERRLAECVAVARRAVSAGRPA
jgi:glycosyltransferase involved in cell wall biosynthesis